MAGAAIVALRRRRAVGQVDDKRPRRGKIMEEGHTLVYAQRLL
jgi:hypothetical protein